MGFILNPLITTRSDAQQSNLIKKLVMEEGMAQRALPEEVDNSSSPWFPPIYSQIWFPNCQQASGVYHALTYALNRERQDTIKTDDQIMATNFTYNFYDGESQDGVSFLHSYQLIKEAGNPTRTDFGYDHAVSGLYWMSGYDKYVRAMNNTLDEVLSIPLNTEEGVNTMRNWLFDHLDGSEWGGVAVYGAHPPITNTVLPPESPHAGFLVMARIITTPAHGMTIVGYSDSIRYDINNDGLFTNNIDINGDGRIDLGDWEIGGYLVVNSYGEEWGTNGKFYLMYSAFAQGIENWGAPNECAYVVKVKKSYTPLMTAKFLISHNMRNRLSLKAGIAADTSRAYPEVIRDYQIFNYLGHAHNLSGNDSAANGEQLEAALDLTPLLSYVEAGKPFKVFFVVDQRDVNDGQARGVIHRFSVVTPAKEFVSSVQDLSIKGVVRTLVPVLVSVETNNQPVITTPENLAFVAGIPLSKQIEATGGMAPYRYDIQCNYQMSETNAQQPPSNVMPLPIRYTRTRLAYLDIPFEFPFYGKKFSTLYIGDNGTINFDSLSYPYAYIRDGLAYLKERFCIAGGYSMSGNFYRPEGDLIMAEVRDDKVLIQWHIVSHLTGDTLMPAVALYPSGKIEIFRPPFTGSSPEIVYSGVSRGNNSDFRLIPYVESDIHAHHCLTFLPEQPPAGFHITSSGLLTFNPPTDTTGYHLKVKVTDDQKRWSVKDFNFYNSIAANAVALKSNQNDSVFFLNINLANLSEHSLQQASLVVSTTHPLIRMEHSVVENINLEPGGTTAIDNQIKFVAKKGFSSADEVSFRLALNSPQLSRSVYCPVRITLPMVSIMASQIDDGHNFRLDPGETADLVVTAANVSDVSLDHLSWKLVSQNEFIVVHDTASSNPVALPSGRYGSRRFTLHAGREIEPGTNCPLVLNLSDASGFSKDFSISLTVGQVAVLIADAAKKSFTADTLQKYFELMGIANRRVKGATVDFNSPAIFLLLGSQSNQHNLSVEEAGRFADYLYQRKNLYVEGFNFWHYSFKTRFNKYLKYSTTSSAVNRYDSLVGHPDNSMASQRVKLVLGNNVSTYSMSMVGNSKPLFVSDIAQPKIIVYNKDTSYKVIGSIAELGNMQPVYPLPMRKLIGSYCDFLGIDTSGIQPLFHAGNRFVSTRDTVSFFDDSFSDIESRQWEFTGATPSVSSEANPKVVYPSEGVYDVKLTAWKKGLSRTICRQAYVNVSKASGADQPSSEPSSLIVFPNPASDFVSLQLPVTSGTVVVSWINSEGQVVSSETVPVSSVVALSVKHLQPGCYFLSLLANKQKYSAPVTVVR